MQLAEDWPANLKNRNTVTTLGYMLAEKFEHSVLFTKSLQYVYKDKESPHRGGGLRPATSAFVPTFLVFWLRTGSAKFNYFVETRKSRRRGA